MEICPKCGKKVDPSDHLTLARSRPISQIQCTCGYYGLPVELKESNGKRNEVANSTGGIYNHF